MKILSVPYINYGNNMNLHCSEGYLSFKGEVGDEFVEGVKSGELTEGGVEDFMRSHSIGKMGIILKSKALNLMKSLARYEQELNARKQDLDAREAVLNQRSENLDFLEQKYCIAKRDEIAGDVRVRYGIESEKVEFYKSFGEQMAVVSKVLNGNKKNFIKTSSDTPEKIVKSMQNEHGFISSRYIDFLKKVISMKDKTDGMYLPAALATVKDEFGDIDLEKEAAFIGSYSWDDASLKSTIQFMNKNYNLKSNPHSVDLKKVEAVFQQKRDEAAERIRKLIYYPGYVPCEYPKACRVTVGEHGLLYVQSRVLESAHITEEDLKYIEQFKGDLYLYKSGDISSIGNLRLVDGNLIITSEQKQQIKDLDKVKVTGKIILK